MDFQTVYQNSKSNKVMTEEKFDLIVEAILAGKYSWACVLILRFSGHNPLDYIPYRTFNRLMKENNQGCQPSKHRNRGEHQVEFIDDKNQTKVKSIAAHQQKHSQKKQASSYRKNQQDARAISCN